RGPSSPGRRRSSSTRRAPRGGAGGLPSPAPSSRCAGRRCLRARSVPRRGRGGGRGRWSRSRLLVVVLVVVVGVECVMPGEDEGARLAVLCPLDEGGVLRGGDRHGRSVLSEAALSDHALTVAPDRPLSMPARLDVGGDPGPDGEREGEKDRGGGELGVEPVGEIHRVTSRPYCAPSARERVTLCRGSSMR